MVGSRPAAPRPAAPGRVEAAAAAAAAFLRLSSLWRACNKGEWNDAQKGCILTPSQQTNRAHGSRKPLTVQDTAGSNPKPSSAGFKEPSSGVRSQIVCEKCAVLSRGRPNMPSCMHASTGQHCCTHTFLHPSPPQSGCGVCGACPRCDCGSCCGACGRGCGSCCGTCGVGVTYGVGSRRGRGWVRCPERSASNWHRHTNWLAVSICGLSACCCTTCRRPTPVQQSYCMPAHTCASHVTCCGCVPGSPCPSRPCGDPCGQHTRRPK